MTDYWNENWNLWKKEWSFPDWSNGPTTADQARIVRLLKSRNETNKDFLNVGVGDSTFVLEFPESRVDGITIIQNEKIKADSLKLPNYRVFLCNKYCLHLLDLGKKYDYIMDNSFFGYTDCNACTHNILFFYMYLLKKEGEILTDSQGLYWLKLFTTEKLRGFLLEHKIPLKVIEYKTDNETEFVIGLKFV